jgi:hypothetical protein
MRNASIDAAGAAIPWITYSSLYFIEGRINSTMTVFEFGSGASTLWWAKRVASVVSCEHDETWHSRFLGMIPLNVRLMHVPLAQGYADTICQYREAFDVIIIDGRERVRCAENALAALKSEGVIIWDNADRLEYTPGFEFLARHGFRRLDFIGMGPINVYSWSTAVFYREHNCFRI